MTPQQIIGLAVRFFAAWLVLNAIQMVAYGEWLNDRPGLEPSNGFLFWVGAMVAMALALWFFPMVVAHKLIPRTKFDEVLRLPATQAVTVACIILGLWLFTVRVLPGLAQYISLAIALRIKNQPLFASDQFTIVRLGAIAIELGVSALLCFRAHAIGRILTTERTRTDEQ